MREIERSAIVPHSAARMFALVDDVESYPRFLPWCAEARVEERTAQGVRAALTVALAGLRVSFTTQNENRPGEAIDMRLVRGPFRRFDAAWRFIALSEASCRIEFRLQYELAGRTLGRLLEPLLDGIADRMVDAFTRRADEVHGGA